MKYVNGIRNGFPSLRGGGTTTACPVHTGKQSLHAKETASSCVLAVTPAPVITSLYYFQKNQYDWRIRVDLQYFVKYVNGRLCACPGIFGEAISFVSISIFSLVHHYG